MAMSQREAARLWGVPRITVQRAVASGKLSLTGDKKIDPAEMTRFFGPVRSSSEPDRASQMTPNEPTLEMAKMLGRLEAEVAGLRALVASKDETIAAMRLLTHDGAPRRRRWWPFGG